MNAHTRRHLLFLSSMYPIFLREVAVNLLLLDTNCYAIAGSVRRLVGVAGVTERSSVNMATTTCSSRTVIPLTNRRAASSATLVRVRHGKLESGAWYSNRIERSSVIAWL